MKNKFTCLAVLLLFVISVKAQPKSFKFFHQVRYSNTPTSLSPFLLPLKIAGENVLLNASDSMPNQSSIDSFARTCPAGVTVTLDLETWPYYPSSKLTNTINRFITAINYFKAANTVSPVGIYGVPPKQAYEWKSIDPVNNPGGYYNFKLISDSLARMAVKLDNFQPSFYTYESDTTSWRKMVDTTIAATKRYSTTKPIYAYIWPQYHESTVYANQLQFIDTAIWRYQLRTLYDRTDGVIIWTSNKSPNGSTIYWDPNMLWWQVTKSFMVEKSLAQPFVLELFNAKRTGNNEKLSWRTSVDTTSSRFFLERSTDGLNFQIIDSIERMASYYTENNYQYSDNSSSSALSYRLKILHKNGSIIYSNVATANQAGVLAVLRIGGVNGTNGTAGSTTPGTAGTPIHIDKYAVTAPGVFTFQNSIDLPAKSTTMGDTIYASSSTGEGFIIQSANKQWLSVMGYGAKTASGTIYSTTGNPNLPRTLGLIKNDTTIDLSTSLSNFPVNGTAATAQSAITNTGTELWASTNQGVSPMGVLYTTPGAKDAAAAPSTMVTSATGVITSVRSLAIFGGDLYYVSGSGNRIGTVSATGGLPTAANSSVMTGLPLATGSTAFTTYGPSQIVMFDMDSSILGYDVMYVTNAATTAGLAGIYKYCKNSAGKWVSFGTFGTTSTEGIYFGITGEITNGLPVLYVTRGITATQNLATNQLLQLTESGGYNATMNAAIRATTDASISGLSGTIRGVAFFPTPSFYYKGTGNLNDVTSWGTNLNGSGTAPTNFTDDDQVFFINNGNSATLSANWTISGSHSKIILGNGTTATSLIIPATFSIIGKMDVYNNATLNIKNVQSPTLHYVAQNSTITYSATTNQAVKTMAYGNFYNTNTSAASINGTVTVEGNTVQNGTLQGNATLIVTNGLNNNGTLAPGNSAGLFTVTGNFTNAAGGTLAIELGGITPGTNHDQLNVSGTATIAGILNLTTINGFVPQVGQIFTIVNASAVTGSFTTVTWPSGVAGNVNYTPTTVELNITGVTLPLHLISFAGSVLQKGINELKWKTADENNVDFFEVERSEKGNDFVKLRRQTAIGVGNNNYQMLDENPFNGSSYYRLKMVDKDGKFTMSNIVNLKNATAIVYKLYPNPADKNAVIEHPVGKSGSFIQLMQADGKVLLRQNIALESTQSILNLSYFAPGIYTVIISAADYTGSLKLIKK